MSDLLSAEPSGKPQSVPLRTAGLVSPFGEQVYLLICLSSINSCAARKCVRCSNRSLPLPCNGTASLAFNSFSLM